MAHYERQRSLAESSVFLQYLFSPSHPLVFILPFQFNLFFFFCICVEWFSAEKYNNARFMRNVYIYFYFVVIWYNKLVSWNKNKINLLWISVLAYLIENYNFNFFLQKLDKTIKCIVNNFKYRFHVNCLVNP